MATLTTAALSPRGRQLAVDTASASEMPFLFYLDNEVLRCTNGGGTLFWDVDRHVNGTASSTHALGATVIEVADIAATPAFAQMAVSSASSPSDLPADSNAMGLWLNAKAAGDHRAIYTRLYFKLAGASGEAIRAYGTVSAAGVAAGGTVNGVHSSLKIATGGSVSGAGNALRATLETDASVTPGGTLAVIRADTNFGNSSVLPATAAFLALDNLGTPKLDLLAMITNPSTTMFANAGTGANSAALAGGGVAAKALKITVDGTPYWLPLFSSNS